MQAAVCTAAGTTLTGVSSVSAQERRESRDVLREFPYGAVQLTGGPLKQHFDRMHAHYVALDNDRLLKVFRQRAGLPAPGPDMGGMVRHQRLRARPHPWTIHIRTGEARHGDGRQGGAREGGAVTIVQDTGYPAADSVRLTVREPGDGRFAMKLRIPAWAKGATLRVNDKVQNVTPGGLATVRNHWKAGDTIDLIVPQPLRTLSIDTETPNVAALMRGAVMYAGLNPWDGITEQVIELPRSLSPLSTSSQAYAQ